MIPCHNPRPWTAAEIAATVTGYEKQIKHHEERAAEAAALQGFPAELQVEGVRLGRRPDDSQCDAGRDGRGDRSGGAGGGRVTPHPDDYYTRGFPGLARDLLPEYGIVLPGDDAVTYWPLADLQRCDLCEWYDHSPPKSAHTGVCKRLPTWVDISDAEDHWCGEFLAEANVLAGLIAQEDEIREACDCPPDNDEELTP